MHKILITYILSILYGTGLYMVGTSSSMVVETLLVGGFVYGMVMGKTTIGWGSHLVATIFAMFMWYLNPFNLYLYLGYIPLVVNLTATIGNVVIRVLEENRLLRRDDF